MRKYLMSFVMLLFAAAAMANNGSQPVKTLKLKKIQGVEQNISNENVKDLRVHSCTAKATIIINGVSTTFENTVTCDCSNSTACAQANAGNSAAITAYVQAIQ